MTTIITITINPPFSIESPPPSSHHHQDRRDSRERKVGEVERLVLDRGHVLHVRQGQYLDGGNGQGVPEVPGAVNSVLLQHWTWEGIVALGNESCTTLREEFLRIFTILKEMLIIYLIPFTFYQHFYTPMLLK